MNIQVCRDPSDAAALYLPQRLYLKSFAKINISVQLPSHKVHGKSISNWELMEKFRKMIQPDSFSVLKVSKHSSEVIRFDAELESRDNLERVLTRLDDRVVQLKDYPDQLKVRVCEAKSDFPSRHDWDSFFRDTTEMDEMKPGERPDTIHISNLPIRWFVHARDKDEDALPSESLVKKIFEKFGTVRQVDIPASDPYRMQMKTTMRGITIPPQDAVLYFEAYVQFSEYVGFVRCMDALRGRKLLRKRDDIAEWCGLKVAFDTTKHMTDAAVKRRSIVRERLASRQKAKDDEEKAEKEKIAKREAKERQKYERTEREKLEKMREREERRKKKQLAKLMKSDSLDLNSKVAEEQKKLMKAQKKMQAIRLIEELFKRIELRPELQRNGSRSDQYYLPGERVARARIIDQFKRQQQEILEEQRNNYNNALNGRIVIRTALETKKPKRDSSMSSVSSDGRSRDGREGRDSHKHIKTERLTTPEREMEYNKTTAAGMYSMPYGFGYPFCPPGYAYPPQTSMYYPVRGQYYAAPGEYVRRARGRARGRGGRGARMPYFDGPDANHQYYRYFKKLTENNTHSSHEERSRGRSHEDRSRGRSREDRSRGRSHSRSRSRRREHSRSRSRRRSYTRSRSRSRRSRSRRSRSRRTRSRSRRSRSYHSRSRSRSRSHRRSRSRRSRSRSQQARRAAAAAAPATVAPAAAAPAAAATSRGSADSREVVTPTQEKRRSRSWSQIKDTAATASPKDNN